MRCLPNDLLSRLERVANECSNEMNDAANLGVQRSETTTTEDFFRAMARYLPSVTVVPTDPNAEATKGSDWELSLYDGVSYLSAVMQAKRLYPPGLTYKKIGYKAKNAPSLQMDMLIAYAAKIHAVPLYAFYNPKFRRPPPRVSHPSFPLGGCELHENDGSWGVSIAHAKRTKGVYASGKDQSFVAHSAVSRPLRCLACTKSAKTLGAPIPVWSALPPRGVLHRMASAITALESGTEMAELASEFYFLRKEPTQLAQAAWNWARGQKETPSDQVRGNDLGSDTEDDRDDGFALSNHEAYVDNLAGVVVIDVSDSHEFYDRFWADYHSPFI